MKKSEEARNFRKISRKARASSVEKIVFVANRCGTIVILSFIIAVVR